MRRFMSKDGVISFGAVKRLEGWHLNEVCLGAVEGPVATVADIGTGSGKEGLGMLDAGFWVKREIAGREDVIRQSLNLFDVENRIGFQEGDFLLGFLA